MKRLALIALLLLAGLANIGCSTTRIERHYTEDTNTVGEPVPVNAAPREGDRRPGKVDTATETTPPRIIIE